MKKFLNYGIVLMIILSMQLQLFSNTGMITSIIWAILIYGLYVIETYNKFEEKKIRKILIYIIIFIIAGFIANLFDTHLLLACTIAIIGNMIFDHIKKSYTNKEFYIFNIIIIFLGIIIVKIIPIESRYIIYIALLVFIYELSKKIGNIKFKMKDIIAIIFCIIASTSLSIYCIAQFNNTVSTVEEMLLVLSDYNKNDRTDIIRAIDDVTEIAPPINTPDDSAISLISDGLKTSPNMVSSLFVSLKKVNGTMTISYINERIEDYIAVLESLIIIPDMLIVLIQQILIESVIMCAMGIIIIYYNKKEFDTYN